ncbi:unnamed protein product [Larinioides sclopetarius]|uniref:Uncharacterized protein n=1 Tax=Larinioides sclopetarius TaxID=280406 RepID=A0AAV2C095_9ARAC
MDLNEHKRLSEKVNRLERELREAKEQYAQRNEAIKRLKEEKETLKREIKELKTEIFTGNTLQK